MLYHLFHIKYNLKKIVFKIDRPEALPHISYVLWPVTHIFVPQFLNCYVCSSQSMNMRGAALVDDRGVKRYGMGGSYEAERGTQSSITRREQTLFPLHKGENTGSPFNQLGLGSNRQCNSQTRF